mmetsp:Transcript_15974/g.19573  ORF Transcript_15974/g.19573 Transcript_15974/m.19573 type:complete len:183 (-) Transcript_15974:85-633(-)
MRPLTPEEIRIFFEKLAKFIGRSIKNLIESKKNKFVFRYHSERVYYISKDMLGLCNNFDKKKIISAGTCFGKFTRSKKDFKLHITCLEYISQYGLYKIWIKPKAEMSFLYGNHILKAQVLRVTENTPQYQGIIVYNQNDIPLGFGVMSKTTTDARKLDPTGIMVFNQCDIGQYLRKESTSFA